MSEAHHHHDLIKNANLFISQVPFCAVLGLELVDITLEKVITRFHKRPELVGNPVQGILHGGVISAAVDTTGGLISMAHLMKKVQALQPQEQFARMSKLGTIDMRIDYLRPGRGDVFTVSATLLRIGNKVAVSRMECHDDTAEMVAVGTGTYLVG